MEQLVASLDKLVKNKNEDPSRFYTYLSDYTLTKHDETYFMESFIPKVYYLYDRQVLRKDIVYLSLLASENLPVIEKFIEYDKSVFVLDIEDPASLYDYYVYEKKHWLYEVVNNPSRYDKLIPLKGIYNKLKMIKFVQDTNLPEVDIEHIDSLSKQIDVEVLDDFWKFYLDQIVKFVDVVKFCKALLKRQVSDTELFVFASKNSLLDTLSNFVDLWDSTRWEAILDRLKHGDENELNVFTGFVIIATLIKLLLQDNHNSDSRKKGFVNSVFDDVKAWLLGLRDKRLQVELLDDIFSLMFHRNRNEFVCKEKEIRFILFLLKAVIEELQVKRTHEKDSPEHEKLCTLMKLVTDFLWRLDLIVNTNRSPKVEEQLLNYMLAPPESLIHICLKRRNFDRAREVIQIFDMNDSDLAREVNYAESLLAFKKFLRKNGKFKGSLAECVDDFFQKNPPPVVPERERALEKLQEKVDYAAHFRSENATFMSVFDFALTSTKTWEESDAMLKLAAEKYSLDDSIPSNYRSFYHRITELANVVGPKDNVSLPEILIDPKYPLDLKLYTSKEEMYDSLDKLYREFLTQVQNRDPGGFNRNHPSHKTLLKMNDVIMKYHRETSPGKEPVPYLLRLYNYLKAFSKVLYIEQNSSDIITKTTNASFFDLLDFNRSELTGKLLFERQLDPTEFERYFGRLKLDFLYHVVGNCFPTINLHVQENVTSDELYHDNMLYIPSPSIIVYIQKRNWLLAFILKEMYKVEGVKMDVSEARLRPFFNYLRLPRVQRLKALFEDNEIVAALQNCISVQKVRLYFREHVVEHDDASVQSANSNNSEEVLETGEEILEDAKTTNWKGLYDLIESVPEIELRRKPDLMALRDMVLANIVQDGFEPEYYRYCFYIQARELRIDTILNNFKKWPGKFASDIIRCEASRFDLVRDSKVEALEGWLQHVELCEKLKVVFGLKSWYKSYRFCEDYTEKALDTILDTDEVDHLLAFLKLYKPPHDTLTNISTAYLSKIMDLHTPLPQIKTLLDSLPFEHAIGVCRNLLATLRNLEYLQFVADYLGDNVANDPSLKNVQLSLKMLAVFLPAEREQLFRLLNAPLSLLEVLLMNTKLDKLAAVLEVLSAQDSREAVCPGKVDELLRRYAEKSLDFRVATRPIGRPTRAPEPKLLQSFDSLSASSEKRQFVVPEAVPTKEEWVRNEEAAECMCCGLVTFSMFSRRHHCRRCGRVVCHGCSSKRMSVPSYGDLLVRVCVDCHAQSGASEAGSERSEQPSTRSQGYWQLEDDPEHDAIVREEFSYEHAPSVSLCLSILKHHSRSAEYPKFLLEQCEVMLRLLQPNKEPTHEIDYLLVIRMLKSLATAAKMVSAESMLGSGAAMADRILSQAELLAMFAERGCLNLVPLAGSQSLYVDAAMLRRLRDSLLQREEWNLALEVSTKAGLDNAGVFAAWGKSCLKAGSLLAARDKFQRCFDRHSQYESSSIASLDSLPLSRSRLSSRISISSALSAESKPARDPPLLHEIVQILEAKTRPVRPEVLETARRAAAAPTSGLAQIAAHTDTALDIVGRIRSLREIAAGDFRSLSGRADPRASGPALDPVFYDECVHYLGRYGTHLSLLEFYVRHGDVHAALLHVLESGVGSDVFVEVYMRCLERGIGHVVQENMSRIDSSLDVWKDHVRQLCRHLEKQQMLNCLYQLQLYIGDYVRAAMTCVRFYEENVRTFAELENNVGHLYKGEEHLRQVLEQEQWVEVSVDTISSASKDSFEERMLSNPDLVMKIDTRDVHKHINTVSRQVEVVRFLARCESSGVNTRELLTQLASFEDPHVSAERLPIPTLFGSASDKVRLAVMAIVAGATVDEGFPLAVGIVDDFKLRPLKVYCLAAKQLARSQRYGGITQLVNCIKGSGVNDAAVSDMLDEMLSQAVGTLVKADVTGTKVEELIKLIKDRATKISAYIEAKQLKTAYFLAVKYKRTADIRRIQREAELLNMPAIKALCQKVLQSTHSKE